MRMNSNAKLWVEALRSGRYRQTRRRLRQRRKLFWRRPALCAIGVLYDLYLKSEGRPWPADARHGQLPASVLEWAGVTRDLEHQVVTHNDTGTSFTDIASVIEAHFYRAERDRRRWNEAARIADTFIATARSRPQHRAAAAGTQA
jgi:hypothetical protein